jgi:hypothetical protein
MTKNKTPSDELQDLLKAKGSMGAARFLRQFRKGRGDYTADRAALLGNPSVDDIVRRLEKAKPRGRQTKSRAG